MITKRLHVSGLSPSTTVQELESRFKAFGRVSDINMALDGLDTKLCRGFAHLTLTAESEANYTKCLNVYNGSKWKGHVLKISEAKSGYKTRLEVERKENEVQRKIDEQNVGKSKLDLLNPRQRKRKLRQLQLFQPVITSSRVDQLVTDEEVAQHIASHPQQQRDKILSSSATIIPDHLKGLAGWKICKYGRAVMIVRNVDKRTGKTTVLDPMKYQHCLVVFRDNAKKRKTQQQQQEEEKEVPVRKLTWEIEDGTYLTEEDKHAKRQALLQKNWQKHLEYDPEKVRMATIGKDDIAKALFKEKSSMMSMLSSMFGEEEEGGDSMKKKDAIAPEVFKQQNFLDDGDDEEEEEEEEEEDIHKDMEMEPETKQQEPQQQQQQQHQQPPKPAAEGQHVVVNTNLRQLVFGLNVATDEPTTGGLFNFGGNDTETTPAPPPANEGPFSFMSVFQPNDVSSRPGTVSMDIDEPTNPVDDTEILKSFTMASSSSSSAEPLFFFHFNDDLLSSRSGLQTLEKELQKVTKDGEANLFPQLFVRDQSLEDITRYWDWKKRELTVEFKRKHKHATKKVKKLRMKRRSAKK